jgi:hypothetical protein
MGTLQGTFQRGGAQTRRCWGHTRAQEGGQRGYGGKTRRQDVDKDVDEDENADTDADADAGADADVLPSVSDAGVSWRRRDLRT